MGKFWAPDIPYSDKKIIYYSNWSFSGQDGVASIGRAVGSGIAPDITWTDDAKPVISTDKYTYDNGGPCAIDPAVFEDYAGNLWLSFGSHGLENSPRYGGIWIVRLDPKTGHIPIGTDPIWYPENKAFIQLANYGDNKYTENNIEAPFVYKFAGYYYLFVNWDRCCNGIESDYQILVGRSKFPEGPYFDRVGKNLVDGGGTLVLKSKGKYIGPGHAGIFKDEKGVFCFSFHYYDSQDNMISEYGEVKNLAIGPTVGERLKGALGSKVYTIIPFAESGSTILIYNDLNLDIGYSKIENSSKLGDLLSKVSEKDFFIDLRSPSLTAEDYPELFTKQPFALEGLKSDFKINYTSDMDGLIWIKKIQAPDWPLFKIILLSSLHYKTQIGLILIFGLGWIIYSTIKRGKNKNV